MRRVRSGLLGGAVLAPGPPLASQCRAHSTTARLRRDTGALAAAGARPAGLQDGRTRRAIAVWFVVHAVIVVPALVLAYGFGHHWVLLPAGALLAIAIALVSRWWTTIYIAELREGIVLSGSRPGGSVPVVLAWAVLSVVVTALAAWLEVSRRLPGAMAIGGALVGAGVAVTSSWWNRRCVAALRRLP